MADELDQVEAVEAPPEPVAAPEPAVEPEPAAEFHHEPEFLNEPAAQPAPEPQAQPQQWTPQQVAEYNYQRQQQAQQYPQQPQQESTLDRLVRDTDGTIGNIAEQRAAQVAQQMIARQMGPATAQMGVFIQGQANYQAAATDENIKGMYRNSFSKDETFASSEGVRGRVDSAIRGLRENAMMQAQSGDPSGFAIFNNPTFAQGVLALAKIMEGHAPTAAEVAAVPHVASVASATQKPAVELDADTESAIARYGPEFRAQYVKSLEDEDKHNDFYAKD
jgi:hypothetical protein